MDYTQTTTARREPVSNAEIRELRRVEYVEPILGFLSAWHGQQQGGGDAMLSRVLPVVEAVRGPRLGIGEPIADRETVDATDLLVKFSVAADRSPGKAHSDANALIDRSYSMPAAVSKRILHLSYAEADRVYDAVSQIPVKDIALHLRRLAQTSEGFGPHARNSHYDMPAIDRYLGPDPLTNGRQSPYAA